MILFLEKSRDIQKAVAKIPVLYHVWLLAFAEATQLSSGYFSGKCFHATTVPSRQRACLEIGGHAFSERISISIFMLKNRAACKKIFAQQPHAFFLKTMPELPAADWYSELDGVA